MAAAIAATGFSVNGRAKLLVARRHPNQPAPIAHGNRIRVGAVEEAVQYELRAAVGQQGISLHFPES